jgi:hypothetical protein
MVAAATKKSSVNSHRSVSDSIVIQTLNGSIVEDLEHDVSLVVQRVSRSHLVQSSVSSLFGHLALHRCERVALLGIATSELGLVRVAILIGNSAEREQHSRSEESDRIIAALTQAC